jgi:hypothetical protein
MLCLWVWIIAIVITIYFNQKANGDAGKLAKDIEKTEPEFFNQISLFIGLVKIQSSSFIFMLYNNSYKKIKNPELVNRCRKVKMMSVYSMISGFVLAAIAI